MLSAMILQLALSQGTDLPSEGAALGNIVGMGAKDGESSDAKSVYGKLGEMVGDWTEEKLGAFAAEKDEMMHREDEHEHGDEECKAAFEKACGQCKKDAACVADCKEEHSVDLKAACGKFGAGEWAEAKLQKMGEMAGKLESLGEWGGEPMDRARGMPGEEAFDKLKGMMGAMMGEKKDPCDVAVKQLCGQCEQQQQGRECWARCKEEHSAEVEEACEKGEGGMRGEWMDGLKGEKPVDAKCDGAVMELCGQCGGEMDLFGKKDSSCWSKCIAEHGSELAEACSKPVEGVLAAEPRMLAASAGQAVVTAEESEAGTSLLPIIIGVCGVAGVAVVAVAVVAAVVMRKRQRQGSSQRSGVSVLADRVVSTPVMAVPVDAAELSEMKTVSIVVDAQPIMKADRAE
jgi:hypothetical protein